MGAGGARADASCSTRVFRAATWRFPLLVLGSALAAGFALYWLALPVVDPLAPDVRHGAPYGGALLSGVFAALLGWGARHVLRYRFAIGPLGFHEAPRHADGMLVAWSRVATVRCRPYRQRLDLHDPGGRLLGVLQYFVADLPAALELLARHVTRPRVSLPAVFRRRMDWPTYAVLGTMLLPMAAIALRVLVEHRESGAFVLLGALLLVLAGFDLPRTRMTTVTAQDLVRRTGLRTTTVPWHDVTRVGVVTRSDRNGGRRVDVALQLASGRLLHVLPDDADVFALYDAVRTAHAASGRAPTS